MNGGSAASLLEVPYGNNRHRRSLSPMDSSSQYDGSRQRRSVSPMSSSPADSRRSSRSTSPYDGGFDTRHCQGLSSKVALFNKQVNQHMETQAFNPFSGSFNTNMARPKFDKNDANYGKPIAGSKTDLRGQKARSHVSKEILELCEVVAQNGESLADGPEDKDCRVVISFGALFHLYTYISDKVVGILLRARKQKLIDFEGETLFQKRDDHIAIVLLKPIKEIREHFKQLAEKDRELRKQQEHQLYLQQHPELELLEEKAEIAEQREEEQNVQNSLNEESNQEPKVDQQNQKEESDQTNEKKHESKKDLTTIQESVDTHTFHIEGQEMNERQQTEKILDQEQSQVQNGEQQNHKKERSDKTNEQPNESKKDLDLIQVAINIETHHIKVEGNEEEDKQLDQEKNNILNNHELEKQQTEEQRNVNSEDQTKQNEEPHVES